MPNHSPRDLIYVANQALANDVTALSTQPGGSHLHERIRVTDTHVRALEMIDLWGLDPAHEISRFLCGSTECVPDSPFDLALQVEEQAETIEDLEGEVEDLRDQDPDEIEHEADEVRERSLEAFGDAAKRIRDVIEYLGRKGSHKKKAQDMLLSVVRAVEGVRL